MLIWLVPHNCTAPNPASLSDAQWNKCGCMCIWVCASMFSKLLSGNEIHIVICGLRARKRKSECSVKSACTQTYAAYKKACACFFPPQHSSLVHHPVFKQAGFPHLPLQSLPCLECWSEQYILLYTVCVGKPQLWPNTGFLFNKPTMTWYNLKPLWRQSTSLLHYWSWTRTCTHITPCIHGSSKLCFSVWIMTVVSLALINGSTLQWNMAEGRPSTSHQPAELLHGSGAMGNAYQALRMRKEKKAKYKAPTNS